MRFLPLLLVSMGYRPRSVLSAQGAPVLEMTDFAGVWDERGGVSRRTVRTKSGEPAAGADYQAYRSNDGGPLTRADSQTIAKWRV